NFIQVLFNVHDVNEITVLIQLFSFKLEFENVVMRIRKILRAPISADQKVAGDEIAANGEGVHERSCVKCQMSSLVVEDNLDCILRILIEELIGITGFFE